MRLEDLIQSDDPAEACNLLLGFGVTCEDCTSDSEPYCIALEVTGLQADDTEKALEAKTPEDVEADADCQ